jgi:hypothetical protein
VQPHLKYTSKTSTNKKHQFIRGSSAIGVSISHFLAMNIWFYSAPICRYRDSEGMNPSGNPCILGGKNLESASYKATEAV